MKTLKIDVFKNTFEKLYSSLATGYPVGKLRE